MIKPFISQNAEQDTIRSSVSIKRLQIDVALKFEQISTAQSLFIFPFCFVIFFSQNLGYTFKKCLTKGKNDLKSIMPLLNMD